MMTPEASRAAFAVLVSALAAEAGVSWGDETSRKGFGSGALKVNGKMFAMVTTREQLVLKLPKARVDALIADGLGENFDPGHGRLMKEWLSLHKQPDNLIELGHEALVFVRG